MDIKGLEMEKALEILNQQLRDETLWFDSHEEAIKELEEAQLTRREWYQKCYAEAMKPKTCDGCRYGAFGVDSFGIEIECTLAYRCSRGQNDMFKPKDNA